MSHWLSRNVIKVMETQEVEALKVDEKTGKQTEEASTARDVWTAPLIGLQDPKSRSLCLCGLSNP